MTTAHQILDAIVARDESRASPPPFVRPMRMPPIDGWEQGRVWGTWKVDPDFFHLGGAVFGGYLAALADSIVGLAMYSTMADDEVFTTADLRISFFRPVVGGTLEFAAEVVNRGRRLAHVEAVFVDDRDNLVAKATATQVVIPAGG
jgi:uncharacterized protein (TIGR00369 family)